jgi:type I restriction enzyme S subunit
MNDSLVLRESIDRRLESALRPDQHLLVRKGDIAYNMMRMWQGACGLALTDGIVSPAYVVLDPKPSIDNRFAYHWFKSARMIHLFWAYSHGLTEDRLRLYFDSFCEIPVAPPSLEQQRRIVTVFEAWDEAIQSTERLILAHVTRMSKISQLLFGESESARRNGNEWRSAPIGEMASCFSGGTPDRGGANLYGGGIPWVKSGEVASANISRTEETLTEFGLASSSARWVPAGSTLVAMYGANAGQVGRLSIDATTNQAVLALVPNPQSIDSQYLYHSVMNVIPSLLRKVQGSGQPNLSGGIVKEHKIYVPERSRQIKIAQTADFLKSTIDHLQVQLEKLRLQKRGLMQKLLDGECHLDERFDSAGLKSRLALAETI